MDKGLYIREQMAIYCRCFDKVKNFLLDNKGVNLYVFERHFNDRSLTLFPDFGLDDFILDFFSSADYCKLDRDMKSIFHADIRLMCLFDLKNNK